VSKHFQWWLLTCLSLHATLAPSSLFSLWSSTEKAQAWGEGRALLGMKKKEEEEERNVLAWRRAAGLERVTNRPYSAELIER